jgi:hypothetical protein
MIAEQDRAGEVTEVTPVLRSGSSRPIRDSCRMTGYTETIATGISVENRPRHSLSHIGNCIETRIFAEMAEFDCIQWPLFDCTEACASGLKGGFIPILFAMQSLRPVNLRPMP